MDMGVIIVIAVLLAGLGILPAFTASRYGKDFKTWWVYGAVLFPVAMVHAIMLGHQGYKRCGFCRSAVKVRLSHCPHCGYEFIEG